MTVIHLNRNRQNLGQFSPEEVATGLKTGRFLPGDLAWREGMETWQPLSTFADLPEPAENPDPPAIAETETLIFAPVEEPAPDGPPVPEWERSAETGVFRAMLATIRQVITDPLATFRDMKRTGGLSWPLVFSYCVAVFCSLASVCFSVAWLRFGPASWFSGLGENPMETMRSGLVFSVPAMLVGNLLSPFLMSGLYFLAAKLFVAGDVRYEPIFRAYCYVNGAVSVFLLLPYPPVGVVQIGYIIFVSIISLTYQALALHKVLPVSGWLAAAIALFPIVICCLCMVGMFMAIGALGVALPQLQGIGN